MNIQRKVLLGQAAIEARSDQFDEEHRRSYMNASEADTCIRKQWYSKHQPELATEQSWGYARRGRGIEAYMVASLRAANVDLRLADREQESVYSDKHKISATPDGVIVDHENEMLIGVEFKSLDPRANRGTLPKKAHLTQLQIGMALLDLVKEDIGLPDWPWSHGLVVYTDASNWDDIEEFRVPYREATLDDLADRAAKILCTRNPSRLPREGRLAGGYECKTQCPFKDACGVDVPDDRAARGNRGSRLDDWVARYMNAKAQQDDIKAQQDEAAEHIKEELRARNVTSIGVGDRHVTLTRVAGRRNLDRKLVEAAGIDLTPYEKIGAPSERLVVK
jgi:hypothetical protein